MTFKPKTLLRIFGALAFTVFMAVMLFAVNLAVASAHESDLHTATDINVSSIDTKDNNIKGTELNRKRALLRERMDRRRDIEDRASSSSIKDSRFNRKRAPLRRDIQARDDNRTHLLTGEDIGKNVDDSDRGLRREKLRAEIKEKRREAREKLELRRSKIQEKRAGIERRLEDRRTNLENKAKERIRAFIDRIENRFGRAIDRLEKISGRILSRIEKFEERGTDMSTPRDLLEKAATDLDTASEAIGLFKAEAYAATDADNPKAAFDRVHELAVVAKDSIKDAHATLVEAIKAIKAEVDNSGENKDVGKEASSTAE